MAFLKFRIIIENGNAKTAVADVEGKIDNLKVKAETPSNIKLKIYGAKVQPAERSFEKNFLKLNIPRQEKKIFIKPCT